MQIGVFVASFFYIDKMVIIVDNLYIKLCSMIRSMT